MIKVVLALAFVLGLLLLSVYVIKWLGQLQNKSKVFKKIAGNRRINVIEYRRIDAKHSVVIFEIDGKEIKMILGNGDPVKL
ncbi:MAG: hypothetical protein R3Y43_01095 [Alphaproteobacteria bacterium]